MFHTSHLHTVTYNWLYIELTEPAEEGKKEESGARQQNVTTRNEYPPPPGATANIYISGVCIGEEPENIRNLPRQRIPPDDDDDEDRAVIYIAGACTYPNTREQGTNTTETTSTARGEGDTNSGKQTTQHPDAPYDGTPQQQHNKNGLRYSSIDLDEIRRAHNSRGTEQQPTLPSEFIHHEYWDRVYDSFYSHPVDNAPLDNTTFGQGWRSGTGPLYGARDEPDARPFCHQPVIYKTTRPTISTAAGRAATYREHIDSDTANTQQHTEGETTRRVRRLVLPNRHRRCTPPTQQRDFYDLEGRKIDYNDGRYQQYLCRQEKATRIKQVKIQINELNAELRYLQGQNGAYNGYNEASNMYRW